MKLAIGRYGLFSKETLMRYLAKYHKDQKNLPEIKYEQETGLYKLTEKPIGVPLDTIPSKLQHIIFQEEEILKKDGTKPIQSAYATSITPKDIPLDHLVSSKNIVFPLMSSHCSNPDCNFHHPAILNILEKHLNLNKDTGCWEWIGAQRQGCGIINVRRQFARVPRLSAHIFNGFDLKSPLLICHKCDNPSCFNPDHLFFGTHKNNTDDMIAKGRMRVGEAHPRAKLKAADVLDIIKQYDNGASKKVIAARYGIHPTYVALLARRKYWAHLHGDTQTQPVCKECERVGWLEDNVCGVCRGQKIQRNPCFPPSL